MPYREIPTVTKVALVAAFKDAKGDAALAARNLGISRRHFDRLVVAKKAKAEIDNLAAGFGKTSGSRSRARRKK